MAKVTEEEKAVIQQLSEKFNGRIRYVKVPEGLVVVKYPKRSVWARAVDKLNSPKKTSQDAIHYELVIACVVHPASDDGRANRVAFDAIVEEYPAMVQTLADAVTDLATGGDAVELSVEGN